MKTARITSAILIGCLFISVAGTGPEKDKDLARIYDPVVVSGEVLSDLFGAPIRELGLMAWDGESWKPVPFQVDQKKPDGEYAFTNGPEASMDPDVNLDGNDELVFLVRDCGDGISPADASGLPAGAFAGVELEVRDPKNGSMGWMYLFRFTGPAPRSDIDYIHFELDPEEGVRRGYSDELTVGSPIDRVYPDLIAQIDPATGEPGRDVLDRLKIRAELELPGGITIPLDLEQMIKCRDTGYIDGPVRVLEQIWGAVEIMNIEIKGIGYSTVTYYPNHMIVPVTVELESSIPAWAKNYMPRGRIMGYMDFNDNIDGSHVFSEANPYDEQVVLDANMSDAEENLDRETQIGWIGGYGPEGGLIVRLLLTGAAKDRSKMVTYYVDNAEFKDPPEDHPGGSMVGFEITGKEGAITEFTENTTFYVYAYAKRDLSQDNAHTILDILDHPLEITGRALDKSRFTSEYRDGRKGFLP